MTAPNHPARLNRAVLGVLGLLAVSAGGYLVAAQRGWLHWVNPHTALVPGTAAPPAWVLAVVAAAAVIIGLAALRWLTAQVRRLPRGVRWEVGTPAATGITVLDSATAQEPLVTEIESAPQVRSATARLYGPADAPELALVVTAEPGADLGELRRHILGHAIPRLSQALEIEVIPLTLEIGYADRGRTPRVR